MKRYKFQMSVLKPIYFNSYEEAYNYLHKRYDMSLWHRCTVRKLNWIERLIINFKL